MRFVVYAIQSSSGRIYIGQTQDLSQRLLCHNSGVVRSTCSDLPWSLLKHEVFLTRNEARYFEFSLKRSRGKREKWLRE